MKKLFIPDRNNLTEALAIANEFEASFEYNDFVYPQVYDSKDAIDEIIKIYKSLGRDMSNDTMHGAFLGIDIAAIDPVFKARSRELCEQSLMIADRLGIKAVVFHTGLIGTLHVEYYVNHWICEASQFFIEMCKKYPNLTIYMENSFEQEPDVFVRLMDTMQGADNFKLCLDYGHAIITSTDIEEWVEKLAPYIGHMHINDNDLKDDLHLVPGEGQIDFDKWSSLMDKYGIDSSVLIELNGLDKAKQGLEFLKKMGK